VVKLPPRLQPNSGQTRVSVFLAANVRPFPKWTAVYRLGKKPVIGDDEKKSLTKFSFYKSFFVFEIQMIENLVKIASTLLN
jgi:hypothetical protein